MAYFKMYGGRIIVQPIQITVTLYSAASDTVTFTDDNGSHSVQTNSSGVASNVSIKYTPQTGSAGLVFTSSVAKDPTNLSNAYSKAVPITGDTTEIYVMPDGDIFYWYGYNPGLLEDVSPANGWSGYSYAGAATFSTNYIICPTGHDKRGGVGTKNTLTQGNTVHCIGKENTTFQGHNAQINAPVNKNRSGGSTAGNFLMYFVNSSTPEYKYASLSSDTLANKYLTAINITSGSTDKFYLYALWVTS